MRQTVLVLLSVLLTLAAVSGCTKKAEQSASMTSSDSLVSSNPSEQTPGNLTPGQPPPQQTPPPESPPPSRAPRHRTQQAERPTREPSSESHQASAPGVVVPSGTSLAVVFSTDVSSENAKAGDSWTGTLKDPVIVGERVVFPAGSVVHGTVRDAKPAQKGDRAMLDLAVTGIEANGQTFDVEGGAEPIVAGSTRARNLGAMAGGAAAGALIGRAVGGSGKGALIGGLLGGAAAGAGVAKSKGYQVEMKAGKEMPFTVSKDARVRS